MKSNINGTQDSEREINFMKNIIYQEVLNEFFCSLVNLYQLLKFFYTYIWMSDECIDL